MNQNPTTQFIVIPQRGKTLSEVEACLAGHSVTCVGDAAGYWFFRGPPDVVERLKAQFEGVNDPTIRRVTYTNARVPIEGGDYYTSDRFNFANPYHS